MKTKQTKREEAGVRQEKFDLLNPEQKEARQFGKARGKYVDGVDSGKVRG